MRLSRLASVFGLALALAAAGTGCDDDPPAPKRDAGRDGVAGSDAGVDRPADTAPRDAPAPAPDTAPPPDAPAPDAPTPDTAIPDRSPDTTVDTAVSPDTTPDMSPDRMVDTPPVTPDTAPPPDTSTVIVAATCATVACPAYTDLANTCNGDNLTCRVNSTQDDRTICFDGPGAPNQVKKVASDMSVVGADNVTSIEVFRANGTACYNLAVTQRTGSPEIWVFSTPAGVEVASATVAQSGATILTCTATGTVYDVSTAGCAGFEGEGNACTNDPTCTVP